MDCQIILRIASIGLVYALNSPSGVLKIVFLDTQRQHNFHQPL